MRFACLIALLCLPTTALASIGTLMEVTCQSVFKGKATTRVTSTRTADGDGYTKTMTLLVTVIAGETERKEQFQVQFAQADYENNGPLVIGALGKNGTMLEISVETENEDRLGFAPADIKINGIGQDYLKFECRARKAG